jgi:hypothetical protein
VSRRVLLDECIDWRLAEHLHPHEVRSVSKIGWAGITSGELLRRAEEAFEVFVTVDRNLSFQQPIVDFGIAVVVLAAKSNRLRDLLPLVPRLLTATDSAAAGNVALVTQDESGDPTAPST